MISTDSYTLMDRIRIKYAKYFCKIMTLLTKNRNVFSFGFYMHINRLHVDFWAQRWMLWIFVQENLLFTLPFLWFESFFTETEKNALCLLILLFVKCSYVLQCHSTVYNPVLSCCDLIKLSHWLKYFLVTEKLSNA